MSLYLTLTSGVPAVTLSHNQSSQHQLSLCPTLTLIRMVRKKYVAVQLGVIYDSQVTNMKQVGLQLRDPLPCCTPIGRLGIVSNSQLAEIHKNTATNSWKLLLFY